MVGFISLTSPYQVSNLDEMSSTPSLSEWEGNPSYSSLSPMDQTKRRELVKSMIRVDESPLMKSSDTVTNQVTDLMIKVWDVFHREGNPGGTDRIEHPVYTPKGVPPIKLKSRPVNPGLAQNLAEQVQTWLKDGVIKSGHLSPWNFPLHAVRKKNGKWR